MKYAALLTNNADDVAEWEKLSPEEAAAARAEEMPKWEALFDELGPTGVLGTASSSTARDREDRARPRRRDDRHRRARSPRRRSRSAA